MINLLAADRWLPGLPPRRDDKTWLYICLAAGVVGIASGLLLARNVLAADQGTLEDEGDRPGRSRRGPRRSWPASSGRSS